MLSNYCDIIWPEKINGNKKVLKISSKAKNERILIMFRITISCNLKLAVCTNYMVFADTVGIYKYQRFGANIFEIGSFLLKLLRKSEF